VSSLTQLSCYAWITRGALETRLKRDLRIIGFIIYCFRRCSLKQLSIFFKFTGNGAVGAKYLGYALISLNNLMFSLRNEVKLIKVALRINSWLIQ
jgi:hypothetical protein